MSTTPEAREKANVKAFLKSIGAYQFWPVLAGYGTAGLDCYACINGVFWGIEVKAEEKKPTERQIHCMQQIAQSGGKVICGTSNAIIYALRYRA